MEIKKLKETGIPLLFLATVFIAGILIPLIHKQTCGGIGAWNLNRTLLLEERSLDELAEFCFLLPLGGWVLIILSVFLGSETGKILSGWKKVAILSVGFFLLILALVFEWYMLSF